MPNVGPGFKERTIALTGPLCWYRQCWERLDAHRPVAAGTEHYLSLVRQGRELARTVSNASTQLAREACSLSAMGADGIVLRDDGRVRVTLRIVASEKKGVQDEQKSG